MTNFTVESKSQLAKLMATENLTIQHSKIQTAKFDPKNRVLYLPIWQNMTGALYDLLTGHEVGHALYTPAEGWHDAVIDKTKSKNFKSFLNVVEDARIEKKVQRKYPGLKASFIKAYTDLMGRDFFGIKGRDINDMAFINRLNIYTKSQYSMKIFFTGEEQKMVEKVKAAESWADVIKITNEIYAYSKDEQFDLSELEDFNFIIQNNNFDGEFEEDSDSVEEAGTGDDEGKNSDDESEQELEAEKEKTKEFEVNNDKESNVAMEDQFEPNCETDEAFRKNESMLLDESSKDYVYVTFPKAHLDKIVTPYKKVHSLMEKSWNEQLGNNLFTEGDVQQLVRDFKNKNEKYISLLAKEFEMKKAAKAFAKVKISDTGDIDINKIATYSFDDNIFRKVMMVPKGKSHGLILLLDYSGSMSSNMGGSIEQILVLAMFCRKVNIPFHVYSFSDSWSNWEKDHDIGINNQSSSEDEINKMFTSNPGEVRMRCVLLREYLNSKMGNAEFNRCLKNMLMLKASYDDRSTRYGPIRFYRPQSENLSNTPLTQAICAMKDVMLNFRKVNNLDLSSLVIVHDGEADQTSTYYPTNSDDNDLLTTYDLEKKVFNRGRDKVFDSHSTNIIFMDPKIKFEYRVNPQDDINRDYVIKATLEWFRKATNSKIFGFFITPNTSRNLQGAIANKYYDKNGTLFTNRVLHWEKVTQLSKELKTNKALVSHNPGFNKFFFILGGKDLNTEIDEIEIEGKVTTNKLKNAFMKFNKKRQVNRIVVSKFIEGIAA